MNSTRLSLRRFSLIIFAAITLFFCISPVSSDAQILNYGHFSADTVVGRQQFDVYLGGSSTWCCHFLNDLSHSWVGDTLLWMSIQTSSTFFMHFMLTSYGTSARFYLESPGTYYLRLTEVYDAPVGPDQWQVFIDTITVLPCGPCVAGDVDHDTEVAISDVTFLAGYMFKGGFPPPCEDEADPNGDGSEDISDLTYLVKYMFKEGASPVCP